MRLGYAITLALLFPATTAWLQPINNTCEGAIVIPPSANWCSNIGEFTNAGATPSGYGAANCFSNAGNDVWFIFRPLATDVTITVLGATSQGAGGTLTRPEVSLYLGTCGGTIFEQQCESASAGNNVVELYKGGLAVGETYFIRVQGVSGRTGTFQLCVNNYTPPNDPGSDCFSASVLCDKNTFVVQQVVGAGSDPTEANDAPCLNQFPGNVESNSTWFAWTAANDGLLTFTLFPLNPSDDLDFVLYEIPNGPLDCRNKRVLRCMASGSFFFPSRCMGPTGLREGETDTSEPPGCNDARQNNFLAPLQMERGKSYALMVNNFSDTGNGFRIEFGGNGEFVGPEADFNNEPDLSACVGQPITFTDASTFANGSIVEWEWQFGLTADRSNADVQGPHTVSYDRAGQKSIVLSIESDRGCRVTVIKTIEVECCGDHFDADGVVTDLTCPDSDDGAVDVSVTNDYGPYEFLWNTGATTDNITGLAVGDYTVTVTDQATCDTVLTFTVTDPPPFNIDTLITMPTCGGGTDGAVVLQISGGTEPYEFNWQNTGFGPSNRLENIPRGDYDVVIRDGNGCEIPMTIPVRELELVLNPTVDAITPPTCTGLADGAIQVLIANGQGPYVYNWNDGQGFRDAASLTGLRANVYNVQVRDANLCEGNFSFNMEDPASLEITFDIDNASCNGLSDGAAAAVVTGGTGVYTYAWANGETKESITNLRAGSYNLTVRDSNNCTITGTAVVTEPAAVGIAISDVLNVVCHGEATGSIAVTATGGTLPYNFNINGGPLQPQPVFNGLRAGAYTIAVEDAEGCRAETSATITEPQPLLVNAGEDQTVELGYTVDLQAIANNPNVTFTWTPPDRLSCADCPNPTAGPARTTVYTITIQDQDNCTASDSLRIRVTVNRPIYAPSAFSPNGDGANDYFTLFGGPGAELIEELLIFDRWGNLVFQTNDIPLGQERLGWNGTFNGKPLGAGVFVYMAKVRFIDQVVVLHEGDVTIVK